MDDLALALENQPPEASPRAFPRTLARALLVAWTVAVSVGIALLMVPHLAPMPAADPADVEMSRALASLRREQGWLGAHVVYSECRCSQRVVDHLLARGPEDGIEEVVLLVGRPGAMAHALEARGFRVETTHRRELAERYHVSAVPLLAVIDPRGELRWAGGYTDRKQGVVFRDIEALVRTSRGEPMPAVPVYGCATSDSLRAALDPLGLRRAADE